MRCIISQINLQHSKVAAALISLLDQKLQGNCFISISAEDRLVDVQTRAKASELWPLGGTSNSKPELIKQPKPHQRKAKYHVGSWIWQSWRERQATPQLNFAVWFYYCVTSEGSESPEGENKLSSTTMEMLIKERSQQLGNLLSRSRRHAGSTVKINHLSCKIVLFERIK